jgi:hypothetical protein
MTARARVGDAPGTLSGGTFTATEIVLCEPAFNGSMMVMRAAEPATGSTGTAMN